MESQLDLYLHHGHDVLLLSPVDAPVYIDHPQVVCRTAGNNAYNAEAAAFGRYGPQFRALLDHHADWYLLNESDSFCLDPEIPPYLYKDEKVVWSNYADPFGFMEMNGESDMGHEYPKHYPVMQAPWFLSRRALEGMVAVHDQAYEPLPTYAKFIDWWFHTATHLAGFDHNEYGAGGITHAWEPNLVVAVSNGAVMVHGAKEPGVRQAVLEAYERRRA